MNSKEWNDGLNHLDPDLVEEYTKMKDNKKRPQRPYWVATVAAALALTVGIGILTDKGILPINTPNLETIPVTEFATKPTTAPTAPATAVPTKPEVTVPATQPTGVAPTVPATAVPTRPEATAPVTQPTGVAPTAPATAAPTRPAATTPVTQPTAVAPTVPATAAPTRPVVTVPPTAPPQEPVVVPLNNLVYAPVYPEMPKYPKESDTLQGYDFYMAVQGWKADRLIQYQQPDGYADSLTGFFHASIQQFLQGEGNQVYSPLNVYLAMAMLAETTDGNSRQQILDLFGLDTIEQLRQQVNHLWNAHYCDDGQTSMLLANSLWLDEAYTFKQRTAKLLADRYYASSFSGDLGTDAMNKQLQSWLNENTGGLLTDQANNTKLPEDSVFALASSVYFTASWENKFWEGDTKKALFHSAKVDREVPFMNRTLYYYDYYWGENFGAVRLALTGDNWMWLLLPDEGYTTADILASDEYLQMTLNPADWKNKRVLEINLSVPKFDVAEQQDLVSGMQAMGLRDVFDYRASDFTPLTDAPELFVGKIDHAARIKIDEEGCEGAAYTVIMTFPTSPPQPEVKVIDFVLDRPFMLVVSSQDNLPLFAGIVNEP